MLSDCENLPYRSGLLFVGLNANPVLCAPGMLTGAELPNKPLEAKPTDIEFETVGDSASKSRSNDDKFNGLSKCSSSKALPEKKKNIIYLFVRLYFIIKS